MFHIEELCPICHVGPIGFLMCSDGKTLVLVCDECNAVWLDAHAVLAESAVFPSSPEYSVEQLHCSVASSAGARWATMEVIESANLSILVSGEGESIND